MIQNEIPLGNPVHPKLRTRAGWRYFVCGECGQQWREASRDRLSPSGVDCECCSDWCIPISSSELPDVAVNKSGNLIEYETVVIARGVEPPCNG